MINILGKGQLGGKGMGDERDSKQNRKRMLTAVFFIILAVIFGTLIFVVVRGKKDKTQQNSQITTMGKHDEDKESIREQQNEIDNGEILKEIETPKPITPEQITPKPITPKPITPKPITPEPITSEPTKEPKQKPTKEPVEEENTVIKKNPVKVKGIYVTGPRAGSGEAMNHLIELVDKTELNAMVIDIKNDSGEITYKMDQKMVKEIGAEAGYIRDIEGLIKRLKEKNIYLIARIVAFKDPLLAKERPELSLKKQNGEIFKDGANLAWVNPYKKEVWDYLMGVAKEAVDLGFDEIQFDYIRFSTDKGMKEVDFGPEAENKTKQQVITEFANYACDQLKNDGVYVSADVYGIVIDSQIDQENVGQNYIDMARNLDYICPMIYPSHYADGSYGIPHPDLDPYQLIFKSLENSKKVLRNQEETAIVRPWLQDFTATWLKNHISYGEEEIKAQIQAVYDAGYEEWILWNGSNRYTEEGLMVEN